jgi:uncharacterized protein (TIGR02147 family)
VDYPNIFSYLDYRSFLRDWFAWKKEEMPRYSHRAFVRRTGQKSPSLLVDVIEGRRNLPDATAIAFCKTMKLGKEESLFFRALVRFDQARTTEEKDEAWQEISASKRYREAGPIEGAMYESLSHWHHAAIRELAAVPGFRADPSWIARRVHPPIEPAQAEEALDALFTCGLLVRTEEGEVVPGEPTMVSPTEVQWVVSQAVSRYHRDMLGLAAASLENVSHEHRHFSAVTAAVPASTLPLLREELTRMSKRLLDLVSTHDTDPEEVVQVQLHFFPLTDIAGDEP